MKNTKFFTGQTESYLLNRLEEQGHLKFSDVYSAYSQREAGRAFLSKLLHFKIAHLSAPGIITLNKDVNEDVKEIEKELVKNNTVNKDENEDVNNDVNGDGK